MGNDNIPNALKIFFYLLFLALVVGIPTFECHSIMVDVDSPKVYSVKRTWWGLKKNGREIKWMKPGGYEYKAWCAKGSDGE